MDMEIDHASLDPIAQQAFLRFQHEQGRPPMPEEAAQFYEKWSRTPASAKDANFAFYLLNKASEEIIYGKGGGKEQSVADAHSQQRVFLPMVLILAPLLFVVFALAWDWFSYTQLRQYFQKSEGLAPWTSSGAWDRTKASIFGEGAEGYFGRQSRGALKGFFVLSWVCCALGIWLFAKGGNKA